MRRFRSIVAVIAIMTVAFTSFPALMGDFSVHAATVKKPAQVKGVAKKAAGTNYITIKWKRIAKNKNTKGYAVYRNGKFIKRVGKNTLEYKHTKLKANTTYRFQVKAYNSYKQKQYFNSKTKKWQVKKPAAKYWKGKKTRKVTKYKYGKASAVKKITTKKIVNKSTSSTTSSTTSGGSVTDTKFKNSKVQDIYVGIDYSGWSGTNYTGWRISVETSGDKQDSVKMVSSDTSVVSLERALWLGHEYYYTPKKIGTSTITITNWDGQKKALKITVQVGNAAPSSVNPQANLKNFALSGSTPKEVYYNKYSDDIYVTLPSNSMGFDVNWTSSNPDAVRVSKFSDNMINVWGTNLAGSATITGVLMVPSGITYNGPKTVSFTVKNTIRPRTKYRYKLYKLKGEIYSSERRLTPYEEKYDKTASGSFWYGTVYFMVVTNNPMSGEKDYLALYDKDTGEEYSPDGISYPRFNKAEYYPARPSELGSSGLKADLKNIPDRTSSGDYVYIMKVDGLKDVKEYNVKILESEDYGLYDIRLTEDTWSFKTKDAYPAYVNWIYSVINQYTKPSMNVHEKMAAITKALREQAIYNDSDPTTHYNTQSSVRADMSYTWNNCYYWDSLSSLYPMKDIGAVLNYELKDYIDLDYGWSSHAYVFGQFNGEEKSYMMCPSSSEAPKLTDYCPQLQMSDFEEIDKY